MAEPEILRINTEEEDEEFYETIEAPKFVDLTAPEPDRHGDDRYWFCSRVGCDQKHEEEMDSEEIYKNFVLRVMAARSPNIRLRKALYRKDPCSSTEPKCPRTVPAKLSKSRIPRLALISSISKRIVDPKVKVKPISKQNLTPNTKKNEQQLSVTTTSKMKKQLSNSDMFRSVRNPKTTASAVPKNRVVAKTLVFSSPKKLGKRKSSLEVKTPLKTLCAEMKKLEITGLKKQVLGYNNKPLPSDNSRKQRRGREVRSRVFDGILTQNHKVQEAKSVKNLKKNIKENHERVENDFNNTDIEEKLGNGSKIDGENSVEEHVTIIGTSKSSSAENEKASSDADDVPKIQASEEITERNDNRDAVISDDKENISEVMENDDKENASASNKNSKLGSKTNVTEGKILGKNETLKGNQKAVKAKIKQSIESSTATAQVLQQKKFKPTNPKPFRLRTDERGILKEANVEKKISSASLGEMASVPRMVAGGNTQKRRQNALQRNDKCLERNENRNDANENGEKEITDQLNKISESKIMKERVRRKNPSTTPMRHTVSSQQKLVASQQECSHAKSALKSGVSSKGTKPPSMQRLARTREAGSSKTTCMTQLGTIIENSLAVLGTKEEAAKASESGDSTTCPVSNHSLQGKRLNTIPKEPNFHAIHTPKSCTRRVAHV